MQIIFRILHVHWQNQAASLVGSGYPGLMCILSITRHLQVFGYPENIRSPGYRLDQFIFGYPEVLIIEKLAERA